MDPFSIRPPSPVLHGEGVALPNSSSHDFSWTCGNDPHILHVAMMGIGGSSEVHKVPSIPNISETVDEK
jgi:hypothetical protein